MALLVTQTQNEVEMKDNDNMSISLGLDENMDDSAETILMLVSQTQHESATRRKMVQLTLFGTLVEKIELKIGKVRVWGYLRKKSVKTLAKKKTIVNAI